MIDKNCTLTENFSVKNDVDDSLMNLFTMTGLPQTGWLASNSVKSVRRTTINRLEKRECRQQPTAVAEMLWSPSVVSATNTLY